MHMHKIKHAFRQGAKEDTDTTVKIILVVVNLTIVTNIII